MRDADAAGAPAGAGRSRVRRRAVVTGIVQGVGFRYSAQHVAESHGVDGWVTNRGDGAVEAVLEGSPDAVEAVLAWLREGPPGAWVRDVVVTSEPPAGERGFEIR
ncbi:acylphosphatase [Beutenbergia cavernae DSM 12333]|uniref:acylphosphatase n=1 Tax=Beutenbergia cavernae (strain ATCC BAA-8 / DSM 12333 / CCUG 43141 / JCM 11478 / NBRC 16432 / NCIMB 13614 / HKI 0122) TaxID=471853 RepID=C5BX84_BEUC1|nr:acylphosphatase [Beutenbergia cavernae DSM 12333]